MSVGPKSNRLAVDKLLDRPPDGRNRPNADVGQRLGSVQPGAMCNCPLAFFSSIAYERARGPSEKRTQRLLLLPKVSSKE
jgi:hypothetical protein